MSSDYAALLKILSAKANDLTVSGPVVVISVNGYTVDVSGLIARLLAGEKLSVGSVLPLLNPDVIRELLPYAGKIAALFGKSSVPVPALPVPIPTSTTDDDDESPISIDTLPIIESCDVALISADADWLGGEESSHATPEELQKIKDGTLDLPPNGVILLGAIVEPPMDPRLLDDKFAYHFVISGKSSGELGHVIVDRRNIPRNPFLRSVPNRWSKNINPLIGGGWEVMIKFIAFYGNAQAEDRWIDYWLQVNGVKSKTYRISWRHHGLLR